MSKKLVLLRCTVIKQLTMETNLSDDDLWHSEPDDLRSDCEDEVEASEVRAEVEDVRDFP